MPKPDGFKKSRFSHCVYDDLTGILYLYFSPGILQDLGPKKAFPDLTEIKELGIHLDETDIYKLKEALENECPSS